MTWLELIQNASPEWIAAWVHKCEAYALIDGKADSEEQLLKFLNEDVGEDELPDDYE